MKIGEVVRHVANALDIWDSAAAVRSATLRASLYANAASQLRRARSSGLSNESYHALTRAMRRDQRSQRELQRTNPNQ